mgnify:FL=1
MKTGARSGQAATVEIDLRDEWLGAFVTMGRLKECLRSLRQNVRTPGEKKAITAMLDKLQRFARYANAAANVAQVTRAVNAR